MHLHRGPVILNASILYDVLDPFLLQTNPAIVYILTYYRYEHFAVACGY